jgi:tRNA (guanine37-N1)-methyltransferase
MRIDIITIFPKMFEPVLNESIVKRAQKKGKVKICVHDLRAYTEDKHRKVDDRPFGGGSGMVMRPEPIFNAVKALGKKGKVILLSPQGRRLDQKLAARLCRCAHLILICGHYEGVDERIRTLVDEEISIGDYILTCGEIPAMVLVDSIVRLIPGTLTKKGVTTDESFSGELPLLEYPQYTTPQKYTGKKVPDILLSGHHAHIQTWKQKEAEKRTRIRRSDLITEQTG